MKYYLQNNEFISGRRRDLQGGFVAIEYFHGALFLKL